MTKWQPGPRAEHGGAGIGAGSVFSRGQRGALFVLFALLVAFRLPHAWVHGRFLDEEATVFLAYAWHRPWLDALFRPFGGYWNMAADATTLLAAVLVKNGVMTLERAPYLTMAIALVVQTLPAVLILTGRAGWLAGRWAVIAALLFIAILPGTEEVFLNVMHIQFHLALCVALILAMDVPRRRGETIGYGVLMVLAPLCGPGAIVILPLFALRALVDRDAGRWKQLAVFAAGSAIQLLFFYGTSPMRGHPRGLATIAATMFVRLIALPTVGFRRSNHLGTAIYHSQMAGGTGWWWSAAAATLLFGTLVVIAARRRDAAIWLALAGLGIAVATFGFGMVILLFSDLFSVGAGERYNFLPLTLIGLTLVALAMRPEARGRPVYVLICLLMLGTGAARYPKPLAAYRRGPSWAAEVAAWRLDHHHPLAVWPRPWAADLSDEARACAPLAKDPTRSTDPRYCESGWVASFYHPPKVTEAPTAAAAAPATHPARRPGPAA